MLSHFFIDRPIFAAVVAIITVLAGAIAIPFLAIEEYPEIAPPQVQVAANYPGANAQTVVDTVTAPIEEVINGVEGMIYMSSTSSDDGSMNLTVTFAIGTDLDLAAVRVQNRLSQAEPRLPEEVRRQGVVVTKQSSSLLMVVHLVSPDRSYDDLYLSNFASIRVRDALSRVPGVGNTRVFGAKDFSMRIWLDPEKLSARRLTTLDVRDALLEQNVQVAAGRLGAPPVADTEGFQLTLTTQGRLQTVAQFENIILKVGAQQRTVRLGDVARIELGAQSYDSFSRQNGVPAPGIGIYQLPGSNALDVAKGVRAALADLAMTFPEGVEYEVTYDFTRFVSRSIREVLETLLIAAALVFFTVWLFLQDWRATLIPGATIPVSIVGTLAVMLAVGFSLNTLTLFGLVLAIGIVVDDSIVVVENVVRHIEEEGLAAREAARRAMDEITGPVIATTLVLLAVFIPTSLLPGLTGALYRQFGVAISVATVLSSVNALTLSPALCALLLRPPPERRNWFARGFNYVLGKGTGAYVWTLRKVTRLLIVVVLAFAGLLAATWWMIGVVPGGFLPQEDKAVFFVNVQLPDAAKLPRTDAVVTQVEDILLHTPGVESVITIGGLSLISGANQSNVGTVIAVLQDWDERTTPATQLEGVIGAASAQFGRISEAVIIPFVPPPIQGLGFAGGFDMRVQDRAALGLEALQDVSDELVGAANQSPAIVDAFTAFRARVPQLFVNIDRTKAKRLGVPLSVVFDTLQANLGSVYVNDLNLFGRVYQVRVQAETGFRSDPSDVLNLEVRNQAGEMLPLGTLVQIEPTVGPAAISRYNLYPAAAITGRSASGQSADEARRAMQSIADRTLPRGMGYEWSGVTYQQIRAGNVAPYAFALAVVFVFLFLAAQYESWTSPIAILLTVPIGVLGALLATGIRGLDNNIYTQVGLVLLIALVCKNAILIVEFAEQRREAGEPARDAAIEGSRLRFRPILMTSFAFVLGVAPLVVATGAGAQARIALGTAVFGGMLLATTVGVVFIPALYLTIRRVSDWSARVIFRRRRRPVQAAG